jgi:hypothetical protein
MTRDISAFVKSCAYGRLSNATSHKAQLILQAVETQAPFDVLFLDVWTQEISQQNGEHSKYSPVSKE